jgi:hypothetical protein
MLTNYDCYLGACSLIGRSCNELQANLVMIEHHYVAFNHKIPNQNNMSIVKLKSICVWISH